MIKRGVINFFKALKYYLIPYGAIALFLAIGLCIAILTCIRSVTTMLDETAVIFGAVNYDSNAATTSILSDISSLDWQNGFMDSLMRFTDLSFLNLLLGNAVTAAFGKNGTSLEVRAVMDNCGRTITIQAGVALAFLLLGIILIIIGVVLLYAFLTLFKCFLIHGYKRIPLKKVLNPLQMFLLYVADIIILALGAALILVLFFLAHPALTIIVRLPLAIITLIVFDINAESFVKQRVIEQSEGK